MKHLYYFEDKDGLEYDVEQDLAEIKYNSLMLRRLIQLYDQHECDLDFISFFLFSCADTLVDRVSGLYLGFHCLALEDNEFTLIRSML